MPVTPELADYISKARLAGLADDVIRAELLRTGWNVDDVNAAVSPRVPTPPGQVTAPVQPVVAKKRRSLVPFLVIIIVILAVGGAMYVFLPQIVGLVSGLSTTQAPVSPVPQVPAATTSPNQSAAMTLPLATSTAGWKIYSSSKYGFEIKYPASYQAVERPASPPASYVDRVDFVNNAYILVVYPNSTESVSGLRTASDVSKDFQTLAPNGIPGGVWRDKLPHLPEEPAGGIYGFDFYNVVPFKDPKHVFDYSYSTVWVNKDTGIKYSFAYLLPKGVTDKNYDSSIIGEFDAVLATFSFSSATTTNNTSVANPSGPTI